MATDTADTPPHTNGKRAKRAWSGANITARTMLVQYDLDYDGIPNTPKVSFCSIANGIVVRSGIDCPGEYSLSICQTTHNSIEGFRCTQSSPVGGLMTKVQTIDLIACKKLVCLVRIFCVCFGSFSKLAGLFIQVKWCPIGKSAHIQCGHMLDEWTRYLLPVYFV